MSLRTNDRRNRAKSPPNGGAGAAQSAIRGAIGSINARHISNGPLAIRRNTATSRGQKLEQQYSKALSCPYRHATAKRKGATQENAPPRGIGPNTKFPHSATLETTINVETANAWEMISLFLVKEAVERS